MYKIYLDNRFITISGHPDRSQKYCLFHKFHDIDDLYIKITEFLKDDSIKSLNIYSPAADYLWQAFRSLFDVRLASGGLLLNSNDEFLFIKRNGRWDVPKGHLEKGESFRECAVREVREETGLIPADLRSDLSPTYHIYKDNDINVLKETHWYIFDYNAKGKASPQTDEGISEVRWFAMDDLDTVRKNTWSSISGLINEAMARLNH